MLFIFMYLLYTFTSVFTCVFRFTPLFICTLTLMVLAYAQHTHVSVCPDCSFIYPCKRVRGLRAWCWIDKNAFEGVPSQARSLISRVHIGGPLIFSITRATLSAMCSIVGWCRGFWGSGCGKMEREGSNAFPSQQFPHGCV